MDRQDSTQGTEKGNEWEIKWESIIPPHKPHVVEVKRWRVKGREGEEEGERS